MRVPTPSMEPAGEVPLIVRIAGLSADAMAAFASDLGRRANEMRELAAVIVEARAALVERLYTAIDGASLEDRRFFLALKRDSFNGRSLRKYCRQPGWVRVLQAIGPLAEEVVRLEEVRESLEAEFDAAYAGQLRRERAALASLLGNCRFLRGVALSSYVLVENLPRLHQPAGAAQHRERRLELSLLRYLSRAALKLSPFSTLTRIGLGAIADRPGAGSFQLVDPDVWTERSSVEVHRSLVDQLAHMLVRQRPFREGLRVSLNETLESGAGGAGGACSFIRPARYECDEASGMVLLGPPALMKAKLSGPLIDWWLAHPAAAGTYGELLATLARELPGEVGKSLGATLDELLDLGFLCFEWPWAATDAAPAARLLDYLETRPAAAGLAAAADPLRRTLALLAEYTRSASPARIVDQANQSMRELLAAAARLAAIDPGISLRATAEGFFHEDVVVASGLRSGEVAHLPARQAQALVDDLTPLVRLSNLCSLRLDVLHTFAAAAAERWPGRTEVPLLEFFSASFSLFRDFVRFDAASRPEGPLKPRHFNPRGLAVLDDLLACRQRVAAALASCLSEAGGERRLDPAALTRLLDELPPAYAAAREFCAFLQPAGEGGDGGGRWVLNTCFEGAGRMSSRYTLTMTPAMRSRLTGFYAARAAAGEGDDRGELVDLFWPAGFSVNVHALQTPRVLTTPGQTLPLAGEQRLTLRDLQVGLRGPERLPVLLDARRRRILPVHLGALSFRYLPSLAKFLTLFGPGELRLGKPEGGSRRVAADVEIGDRHAIGNVIYSRRSWTVEPDGLRRAEGGLVAAAAMLAVNRWRLERGIPDRVYVAERVGTAQRPWRTKPQYIDFTSCHFVEILRTALERTEERLKLVEALPLPEDLPLAGGRRLAAEIQLDSCGIHDASFSWLPTHRGTSLSAHQLGR
jgi:hypothetical protein